MNLGNMMGRSIYGSAYNVEKEIKLIESKKSGEEFKAIFNGKEITVTQKLIDEVVDSYRKNKVFVDRLQLPCIEYLKPNVSLKSFKILKDNDQEKNDYFTFIKKSSESFIDENYVLHLTNTKMELQLDQEAKEIIDSNLAIAVNLKTLEWLDCYEGIALNTYLHQFVQAESTKQQIQEYLDNLSKVEEEAKLINLDLPLRKQIFIGKVKSRLGGLSEKSWGDGQAKNTVVHLGVLTDGESELVNITSNEHLADMADYFCGFEENGKFKGSYYKKINLDAKTIDESGITCKACLKKMKSLF